MLYRAGTFENPHAAAFGGVQKQQLSEALAAQYLEGHATSTGGHRMYGSFDEARNVDANIACSSNVPLQLAVDFNISPGMHCILGQHFADEDLLTAIWEIHEPRMSVKRMVTALREVIEKEWGGWRWSTPLQIFGDASGSGHWAGVGESCYDVLCECLRVAGVPFQMRVPRSNPHVADRVNAVNCALSDAGGKVHYRVHPRCRKLIEDYRVMRWAGDGSADKRDAQRSHASDADGYRVHYLLPIRRVERVGGKIGVFGGTV